MIGIGQQLDNVIAETFKQNLHTQTLAEKEKQAVVAGKSSDDSSGNSDSSDGEENTDFDSMKEPSKTMSDDSNAMKGDVKLDDVVEKLNTIRSGKSFKDSLVQQRFDEYFNSLSEAERVAMFAFFKGVAQIVTGEVESEEVTEPSDKPADIKMKQGPDVQKKSVKPNVIKKPGNTPASAPAKHVSGNEDTSAPIQVKKRG